MTVLKSAASGTAGAAFAKFNAQGQMLWQNLDADGPSNSLLLHAQMLCDAPGEYVMEK